MPIEYDSDSVTGGIVYDDNPQSGGVVFDAEVSPYSPEAIAAQRQALVQSQSDLARKRAEQDEPQYRIGIRPNLSGIGLPQIGTDEPIISAPLPAEAAAFIAGARDAVIPTGAGAAAASAATPYARTAGAAMRAIPGLTGRLAPIVELGIPAAAGLAGAFATGAAREALPQPDIPEESIATVELQRDYPMSTLAGQYAGALPFFRPGLPVGTTGSARVSVPAISGAIGGGVEGARQLASGDFDLSQLSASILGNALLNRETGLTRRIAPNLLMPQVETAIPPSELNIPGAILNEPRMPVPTDVSPAEFGAVGEINQAVANDILAANMAGATVDEIRMRRLAERMMGKTPDQQKDIISQEVKLAGDTLSPQQERGALDLQHSLEQQMQAQRAQERAAADAQKLASEQQRTIQAAAEPPKSTQILQESGKPKSIANVATEVATQTKQSPYALQGQLNAMVEIPNQAVTGTTQTKAGAIRVAVDDPQTQWQYTVFRPGDGIPSAVQVDAISGGRNTVSSNPKDLRAAGAEIPDVPDWVPQGQYTLEQIQDFIKQGEPIAPDTRGMGIQYHGASRPFELRPGGSYEGGEKNILGSGLYTTDAMDIAASYQKKNEKPGESGKRVIYQIKEKSPVRFFDLNEPISDEILRITGLDSGDAADIVSDAYDSISGTKTLGKLFSEMRGLSEEYRVPAHEIKEYFDDWATSLSELGYGGWRDVGGRHAGQGKVAPHDVKVYWFPENQVELIIKNPREKPSNAIRQQEAASILQRQPEQIGEAGGQRSRVEPSIEGTPASGNEVRQGPLQEPLSEVDFIRQQTAADTPPPDNLRGRRIASAMRRERGAINPSVISPVAGTGAGAVSGYALTDREPGENDEEYQSRRLRNAALGAAAGLAGGLGINALAKRDARRQGNRLATRTGASTVVPDEGNIRQTAKKIIENKSFPQRVRESIANDPSIFYDKFSLTDMRARTRAASESDLQQMAASPDAFERLSATAELINRYSISDDPALQDQASKLAPLFAQNMTNPAQIINMGKLIESPDKYADAVRETLRGIGRDLSAPQQKKVIDLKREAIKADRALDSAAYAAENDFSKANEKAYLDARLGSAKAQLAVDEYIQRLSPESWGDILSKTMKGNLLTFKSLVTNPVGNALFQPINRSSRAIASSVDGLISATTGRKPVLAEVNPFPSMEEYKAFAEGTRIAARELLTGPSADSYAKAEIQRGFRPIRALAQAFTGQDLAVRPDGTVSINDRLKRLWEGSPPSMNAEAMFRFLNLGDKGFRRSEEMRVLISQAKLKGLKGRELEKFLLFPDDATKRLIETEGRHAVFAQDNKGIRSINAFLDHALADAIDLPKDSLIRDFMKVVSTAVAPFRQFPVNFIINSANYAVPGLGYGRAFVNAKRGDRKAALINAAEATMGLMMYGGVAWLWENGIISEPISKDSKTRSVQFTNMGPARLNLSGLDRALNGGDGRWKPGDETVSWETMGVPSFIFNIYSSKASKQRGEAARTGDRSKIKPYSSLSTLGNPLDTFPGMASAALDQSFLAGTSAFLDALRDPDEFGDSWARNMFRAISSIAAPNNMEAFARTQYEYIPELRGDTMLESMGNIWKYKTLQLPKDERALVKRGIWGQPVKRTEGDKNPYIDQFIDVTGSQSKSLDPVSEALLSVWNQTESPDVYPSIPSRNFSLEGINVKLTPEDYDMYQQLAGQYRLRFVEPIVSHPGFKNPNTPPEAKIMILKEAYGNGDEAAKALLLQKPGFMDAYFGELTGGNPSDRVISRDPESRLRMRLTNPQPRN